MFANVFLASVFKIMSGQWGSETPRVPFTFWCLEITLLGYNSHSKRSWFNCQGRDPGHLKHDFIVLSELRATAPLH